MSEQLPPDPLSVFQKAEAFLKIQEELYGPIGHIPLPESAAKPVQTPATSPQSSGQTPAPASAPVPVSPSPQPAQPQLFETGTVPASSASASSSTSNPTTALNQALLACQTLDELRDFCETADELRTDLENTRLVFGKGNPQADLLLIGEAPGAKEDEMGEPFVGASGNLLTKILEAIKVDRSQIYIANILKHRPPDNRNPTAEERTRSLPYLERQIDLIQPKLILCLGLISAQTLLQNTTALKDMRGNFYPYRGAELMVTYHPAALLRNSHLKRDTWEDVQKLRQRYDALGCQPSLPPYLKA